MMDMDLFKKGACLLGPGAGGNVEILFHDPLDF